MRQIYALVKGEQVDAPGASRLYAYAGVTLYEAIVAAIPGDTALPTQIKGMPALDLSVAYDWPTVASAALQTVADSPLTSDDSHKAPAALRDKQAAERQTVVGAVLVQRSLPQATLIGIAIAAWAAQDGAAEAFTSLLGPISFTDTTHVKDGQPARAFTSFWAAANEAGFIFAWASSMACGKGCV